MCAGRAVQLRVTDAISNSRRDRSKSTISSHSTLRITLDRSHRLRVRKEEVVVRIAVRWVAGTFVILHGLIHLLGAAQGLGWADIGQLTESISPTMGLAWLTAAAAAVIAGLMLLRGSPLWWVGCAVAAAISQAVILTAWTDAKVGTVINVLLLGAAGYGYASQGPRSYRAEYHRHAHSALLPSRGLEVSEADLAALPDLIADYVRQSGAIGRPRVQQFQVHFHGRIRFGSSQPWIRFTGEQLSTYTSTPSRFFLMDATISGLPVDVLHVYADQTATMRVKACSLFQVIDASGPEMDQGETVTLFNDLCVFAPAALIDAPITWHAIDDRRIQGTFTNGGQKVSAELVFNDQHELIDFISDDRLRASGDGRTFTQQTWSTPVGEYRTVGSRTVATRGDARWHAPDPEGEFSYLDFRVDEIIYNPADVARTDLRYVDPRLVRVRNWFRPSDSSV